MARRLCSPFSGIRAICASDSRAVAVQKPWAFALRGYRSIAFKNARAAALRILCLHRYAVVAASVFAIPGQACAAPLSELFLRGFQNGAVRASEETEHRLGDWVDPIRDYFIESLGKETPDEILAEQLGSYEDAIAQFMLSPLFRDSKRTITALTSEQQQDLRKYLAPRIASVLAAKTISYQTSNCIDGSAGPSIHSDVRNIMTNLAWGAARKLGLTAIKAVPGLLAAPDIAVPELVLALGTVLGTLVVEDAAKFTIATVKATGRHPASSTTNICGSLLSRMANMPDSSINSILDRTFPKTVNGGHQFQIHRYQ